MAITLNDNRQLIDEADVATGWTNIITLGSSNPTPIEAGGWLGANVGAEIFVGYHTIASTDLSDAVIYAWVFSRLALGDTADANGGLMIMLADATPDRIGYKVNGADKAAFRHDNGPTGWQCPALDTTSLPASPYVSAGAAANIDLTAILEVGTIVNSLSAAPGMNPTYNVDIMRYLDVAEAGINGCAADIVGGASGTPGLWSEIAAADRLVGDLQAHGLVRELAAGAFGVQGPLRFGNALGTSASWFEDSNVTVVFEDRGFRTDLYKIFITDNGTGTTTFRLHGSALIAPTGVGAEFDADTDTDVTDVVIDTGSRIAGFIGGVGLQAGHIVTDTIINGSGQVRANGATMNGSSVEESTVVANDSALLWNVNTDPDGLLDDMTFTQGTLATHAIEFGVDIPATITLNGCDFNGYAALDANDGSVFHFLDTTGTITVNLIDCTAPVSGFTYRTAGATIDLVIAPVPTKITCAEADGTLIENVRVFVETADNGGGSGFPFEAATSSLTQAAGVATLTASAVHGLATNDWVVIRGAGVENYNRTAQITVTSTTAFEYTVDSGATSPAAGTPVFSYMPLSGLSDVNGEITASKSWPAVQALKGWVRKSSASPFFKQTAVSITDASGGTDLLVSLQSDE